MCVNIYTYFMLRKTKKYKGGSKTKNNTRRLRIKSTEPSTEPSLYDRISSLNPFKTDESISNKPVDQPSNEPVDQPSSGNSCDNSKCPTGERCDTSTKMCYKLTQLSLQNDNINVVLSVDGKRGKKYDYEFLTDKIVRIHELQSGDVPGQKRGKKYTINDLKKLISSLKLNLPSKSIHTYYGTLRDELIIQIIYLENSIKNKINDDTTVNAGILID